MEMIIKSRVTGKWALSIFEEFSVDRSLLKHRPPPRPRNAAMKASSSDDGESEAFASDQTPMSLSLRCRLDSTTERSSSSQRPSWLRRILRRKEKRNLSPSGPVDPIEIFGRIRDGLSKIGVYSDRISQLKVAIDLAKLSGQTARVETLTKATRLVQYESLLLATGFSTFITEQSLIEFADKCQRGLALTWIGNYGNPIPKSVVDRKVEADGVKAFDNYAVLHYDPKGEIFTLTERQIAAKKDPILFGVIQESRKLYFVGDWKDETDDLDMQEVNRVLGRQPGEIPKDPTQDF